MPNRKTAKEMPQQVDAVVIGASIRGLVATYVLSSLGYHAVLVEKGRRIGGADSSFMTPGGTRFDHGLHVLDAGRSGLATRLFTHVVDGRVHDVVLRRAIALRGHVIPYASPSGEWPAAIRALLPSGDLVDETGEDLPTRDRLARCYGRPFADLIFDEVLRSYPSEARHLNFGVDEARLLTNIYPWFFPQAMRPAQMADESRAFHDKLRAGVEQRVLYPREGGFGGFAEGFRNHFDQERIELILAADDLRIEVAPGSHSIDRVVAAGRAFTAPHYFWAGSWSALCDVLALPCQRTATDLVLLGSFRFDRPLNTRYQEILVGDPEHRINRISFPAAFRESDEPLMQVEFAVPLAETWPKDPDEWRRSWHRSAERLGLVGAAHRVEEFDFRSFAMHFNSFGAEGEPLRDADAALLRADSNVHPVVPSMANLNLNRHVPRSVSYVTAVMAADALTGLDVVPRT